MEPCTEFHTLEDLKQHNARELSHIINQYSLERKYVLKISHFLNKSNEENYIKKLEHLKQQLGEIPDSEVFLTYLQSNLYTSTVYEWQRSDPIDKTPLNHKIHAYYYRKTRFNRQDTDRGKPRPRIFEPDRRMIIAGIPNVIEGINKLYVMIKPFGYDFPYTVEVDGMCFHLCELYNPLYVCEKQDTGPEPILINGVETEPMSNKLYTKLYKEYIRLKNVEKSRPLI